MSARDLMAGFGWPVLARDEAVIVGALIEWARDGDEYVEHRANTPAGQLEQRHGADPRTVGMSDGTEDDFGDLLSDAWQLAGRDPDDFGEAWDRFQWHAPEARTMDDLLAIARRA